MIFPSSKRGNAIMDSIMIIVIIFAFILIAFTSVVIFKDVKPELDQEITDPQAQEMIDDLDQKAPSLLDGAIIFIFAGMWIFSLVASYLIDTHPIFFAIMMIIVVIVLTLGMALSNMYEDVMEDPDYGAVESEFPKTSWTIRNFLAVGIGVIFSIAIVIFAKKRQEGYV